MTNLVPRPLIDIEPCHIGMVTLTPVTTRQLFSIALRAGSRRILAEKLERLFGLELPAVGKHLLGDRASIFWSGPDQWYLELFDQSKDSGIDKSLAAIESCCSFVEHTGGFVRIDVTGDARHDVFNRLCPLDTRRFGLDDVARASIHHISCLIWRAGLGLAVMGPRSTAASLWGAIHDAARAVESLTLRLPKEKTAERKP